MKHLRLALLLLCLALIGATACNQISPTAPSGAVNGAWVSSTGPSPKAHETDSDDDDDDHEPDDDDAVMPKATLTADPPTIQNGQSSTLTWTTTGAVRVTLNDESVALNGSRTVSPAATRTYTLEAERASSSGSGSGEVTVRATVTVSTGTPPPVPDTTPPVLTLPADHSVVATSAAGAVVTFTATAVDAVSGNRPVTCTPASGSTFPLGTTTVNCSASDAAGNTASGSFTVTVTEPPPVPDTTDPVLTLPPNQNVVATSAAGAVVTFTATAVDAVSGNRPVTCTPASGSTFPLGTTTVNCSASDAAGNTASGSFTVTVTAPPDTTDPVLTLPPNQNVVATSAAGAVVTFTATAVDAVSGNRPVTCTPASGSTFPLGTTTVNCSANDAAGNTASGTFTVTVTAPPDTTPPVLTLPPNQNVVATSAAGAVVTFMATAVDAVSGNRPVTCTPASGATFPVGTTTVTCSATDAAGNPATGMFTVTVTAPVVGLTYVRDIKPILEADQSPNLNCVFCHGSPLQEKGLDLRTYTGVRAVAISGKLVEVTQFGGSMHERLWWAGPAAERAARAETILRWVLQGALE